MKILITGNSMSYLSGQPLYCYELARELNFIGHEIEVRSDWNGFHGNDGHKLLENLIREGIRIAGWNSTWMTKDFDLWLASEDISMRINSEIPSIPMINIVHSEYDCETPIMDRPFAWVCIRPSILDHIVNEHSIPREKCHIVYNGVDRERFKKGRRHEGDHNLTVVPCTFDPLREKFIRHCERLASKMNHYHFYGSKHGVEIQETEFIKVFPDTFKIEKPIAEADYVAGILLGRVNLEANSCGVPSKIYDPVTLQNKIFLMPEEEFDERHNIKNVAKQLLKIYDDFIR
jgi:glycosyltransferase involved in cell wall biosynthesis